MQSEKKKKAVILCAMNKILLLTLLVLTGITFPGLASAHDYPNIEDVGEEVDKNEAWYQECLRVKEVQPPKGEMQSEQLIGELAKCEADDMYYDAKADSATSNEAWAKVRACAFHKGDNTVLMMLYANGFGVKVNPDLAIKYACSGPSEPEEMAGEVKDMMELKASGGGRGKIIDQCDYAGNTISASNCASMGERQKDRARNRRLDETSRRLSPNQKEEFDKLRKSAAEFASAHGSDEYEANESGTMRGQLAIEATSQENEQFLDDVEQCEKGVFPVYTQAQFTQLDKQLNQIYREIMRSSDAQAGQIGVYGVVSKTRMRETQRVWLQFRDAWVAFGHARYPSVPTYAWQALLTERRIKQLKDSGEDAQQK